MPEPSRDCTAEVRAALDAIIHRPGHGLEVLWNVPLMSASLAELLPGAQQERNILIAAAQAQLGLTLINLQLQGKDQSEAIDQAAAAMAKDSARPPEVCEWAAAEIALAMKRAGEHPPGHWARPPIADVATHVERTAEITLRMPVARALRTAWETLEAMAWQVEGNAVLDGNRHVTFRQRSRLGELAWHVTELRAEPRNFKGPAEVEARIDSGYFWPTARLAYMPHLTVRGRALGQERCVSGGGRECLPHGCSGAAG